MELKERSGGNRKPMSRTVINIATRDTKENALHGRERENPEGRRGNTGPDIIF